MKKLKNERGESILMALLLLLLASVISALILTAATNAAHHLRNDRKAQQNYLTVSSAAEFIRDSILQESYTRVWEKVTTYTKNDDAGIYVPKEEKTTLAPGKFTGIMKAWLAVGIEDNKNEGARYASVTGYQDTIKVDVPIKGEDGLQTVQAEFTMDKDTANITVKLSLLPPDGQESTGTEGSAAEDCRMTLKITGNVGMNENHGGDDTRTIDKYTTTINWSGAKITKGIKEANSEQAGG